MSGLVEIVRSDAAQEWHVRTRSGNSEPLATSEQLTRPATAFDNIVAQARAFGFDTPRLVRVSNNEALLYSGTSISGHPLPREYVIALVRTVDERTDQATS